VVAAPNEGTGMTAYTVTGHPLNVYQAIASDNAELIHATLQTAGVNATVNLTLPGADDTKIKGHGGLR
jgi:hypothetical protein